MQGGAVAVTSVRPTRQERVIERCAPSKGGEGKTTRDTEKILHLSFDNFTAQVAISYYASVQETRCCREAVANGMQLRRNFLNIAAVSDRDRMRRAMTHTCSEADDTRERGENVFSEVQV